MGKQKQQNRPSPASLPFSQVPTSPSFRSAALNAIAIVPLLSSEPTEASDRQTPVSHSARSFQELWNGLERYSTRQKENEIEYDDDGGVRGNKKEGETEEDSVKDVYTDDQDNNDDDEMPQSPSKDLILVVPNSQLTRPGDWRYDNTPLKNFHWSHGCQRLHCFDGRPSHDRMAQDRLLNSAISRDWIDLIPSRRTAAVVGILNLKDCPDLATLHRAEQELQQWAERYSSPSYEVTAHGRSFARDSVVQRLFVFDSFDEACRGVDLAKSKLGSSLVAFPPSDDQHTHMMDLHLNVVVNDLAVGVFRTLEQKLRDSQAILNKEAGDKSPDTRVRTHSLLSATKGTKSTRASSADEPAAAGNKQLSVADIANVVNPDNELSAVATPDKIKTALQQHHPSGKSESSSASTSSRSLGLRRGSSVKAPPQQLLTPLDTVFAIHELSPRDAEATKNRHVGRREKYAADLSLLAGSPMDAYERYSRAAELCKASPDPLWYAGALEGCAAAHIAMAEAGGYNVDTYLENNFQLSEDIMALANSHSSTEQSSRSSSKQAMKQTLPTVVYALCEEALNILNRHVRLAPFHAELLLKMASYAAELEEGHLRCRWGEGDGCYAGDSAEPRRWERTSVSKLTFQDLKSKDGEDLIALSSRRRCQRWTELMHRAASTGALDTLSRADVALCCTRLCLIGLKASIWHLGPETKVPRRLTMPRKAAFFATIAAEALTLRGSEDTAGSDLKASTLWLTASQLYSSRSNDYGSESTSSCGWATLRASLLHGLSQQEDPALSETAVELLLALLSELSTSDGANAKTLEKLEAFDMLDRAFADDSRVPSEEMDEKSEGGDTLASMASRFTKTSVGVSTRAGFFSGTVPNASLLTVAQAKWADDEILQSPALPLVGSDAKERSLAESIIALSCVIPNIRRDACSLEQKRCIEHILQLRNSLSTVSGEDGLDGRIDGAFSHAGVPLPPPLHIVSASIVKSESHLLLERTKAAGYSAKAAQGAMSTFFNPFEKKKKQEGKKFEATLVAEGEERELLVEFSNNLSIPLDVPSCQLEFDRTAGDKIKAPALSFSVPAKAKKFAVHFPFIVATAAKNPQTGDEAEGDESSSVQQQLEACMFEARGLRVTCMGRSFLLPFVIENAGGDARSEMISPQVPVSASVYQRSSHNKPKLPKLEIAPRIEAVPAQPNLRVTFTTSQTAIEDGTTVPVHLTDGEIFTIPSFRLQNDFGPSGLGIMERLQILGVGLPGLPDEVLFDTDALAAAKEEDDEDFGGDSDEEDFEELMADDGLPPLKMKAFCEGLSLKSINDKNRSHGEGSSQHIVTFQIAATQDMGNQLATGGNVRIR